MQEQLSAQFILGILSRRLAPGERLPSVRQLARQLYLHPNTVSAAYQDLANRGWVSRRHGSGVFVRQLETPNNDRNLEAFVRSCFHEGLTRGFSFEELQCSFREITSEFQSQEPLVMHPDPQLARILATELSEAINRSIPYAGYDGAWPVTNPATCVLVTEALALKARQSLGRISHHAIRLKAMQEFLAGHQRPHWPPLIAVTSHSDSILRWAWTLLSALGFSADSVLLRNPRHTDWQDGLNKCDLVCADVVAASELPRMIRPIIFRIVSDDSLAEIRDLYRGGRFASEKQ